MPAPAADPARALRTWQRKALTEYLRRRPQDFLAVATPGAGKTTFALRCAAELLADHTVQAVTVVTPTEHLKTQWAAAAHELGISLDPEFRNAQGKTASSFTGVAVTYAQVAAHPALHRARTEARRTLVILDEVHHAGDALSWGDAVRDAFTPAVRRLALTGTPFRSDTFPIPFVTYARGSDGITRSAADHSYGYADALREGVVRPVLFLAYSGEMRWRTSAGEEMSATLGEPLTLEQTAHAWRTALDPKGEWIPSVLQAADQRLTQVRRHGMPDAGGLVIASDHLSARAYAAQLRRITGEAPVVVLSDEPKASRKIGEFSRSADRWMVAVRMVSEGVDVPRLAVGVYATSVSTPLFFAQAVGRFLRVRGRRETASVFVPSVPTLLTLAAEMEVERDHALDGPRLEEFLDDALLRAANRAQDEPGEDLTSFEALEASGHFDRVIFDGAEFGTAAGAGSAEEEEYLGLPGLLEPDQVAALLQRRQAEQLAAGRSRSKKGAAAEPPPMTTAEVLAALRRELNLLVNGLTIRRGISHAHIHAEVRRLCPGPPTAQATVELLRARIEALHRWA
ncbi:MAG TPA: DEAD/DEAH box helicase [Mycobacteriales bacterium]|nr:DEAD/DEAH box helicase [Mycobacteriales bacterium]